jgi:murein DD-endopeptidase MepM/ murein hydrolase activator NlpD
MWNNLFRDHEIFVRTSGDVRFLRLSAAVQRRAALLLLSVLVAWLVVTLALLGWQAWSSWQNGDVAARAMAVQRAEAQVAAQRRSVAGIADTLDARQDIIEALFKAHFGEEPGIARAGTGPDASARPVGRTGQNPAEKPAENPGENPAGTPAGNAPASQSAPAAPDEVGRLRTIAARQDHLVRSLTEAAELRVSRAEAALQTVGLRPGASAAQGGPFLSYAPRTQAIEADPALRRLAATLDRMAQLEALLVALPSDLPTLGMALSSGFGFRFDPFTGARAMHSGLDFRGAHGAPIRTAAAGRVSFVGQRSGYGNVVEVDHGHGLMTRYAHLAGFKARVGQKVRSGEQIALMGSTGRSTGTHLHFEVRVGGVAVNPRRFLEANPHVLEAKADAGSRVRSLVPAV